MKNSIFFHEDFYRQIELIPEENFSLSSQHVLNRPIKEDGDYGFTIITNRRQYNQRSIKTSARNILLKEFEKFIEPFALGCFTNITTGYGSTIEKKENTIAWGFEVYGIFAEYDKTQKIINLWLCESASFDRNRTVSKLFTALNTIGVKYNLVLVDWDQNIIVRISNKNNLAEYLQNTFDFTVLY